MARRRDDSILLTAAGLGAIAGLRSMAAPALLSHEMAEEGHPHSGLERLLASDATARILAIMAGGEMVGDKLPFIPDRTTAVPLLGRAAMGFLTAAAYASRRRQNVLLPALAGTAAALAATYAAFYIRKAAAEELKLPDRLLGLMEDALVVAASRRLAAAIDG
jgi:uncharacterized membrane protein